MKHIQKLFVILVGICLFQTSFAASISVGTIEVHDKNTVKFAVSDKTDISDWVLEWEIKVLQDSTVSEVEKSIDDTKKVIVTLDTPLLTNTTYSLLTLLGAEGNIDFRTTDSLIDQVILNELTFSEEQSIDSITIVDASTVEVQYSTEVVGGALEYKLLTELDVLSIENVSNGDLNIDVNLDQDIQPSKEYIFMVISLVGADGNELTLENSIYDFMSPDDMEPTDEVVEWDATATGETMATDPALTGDATPAAETEGDTLLDVVTDALLGSGALIGGEEATIEEDLELEAAGPEGEDASAEQDTEEVALSVSETPDTGAETWVLIFATLFINTFFYFSRRKRA